MKNERKVNTQNMLLVVRHLNKYFSKLRQKNIYLIEVKNFYAKDLEDAFNIIKTNQEDGEKIRAKCGLNMLSPRKSIVIGDSSDERYFHIIEIFSEDTISVNPQRILIQSRRGTLRKKFFIFITKSEIKINDDDLDQS